MNRGKGRKTGPFLSNLPHLPLLFFLAAGALFLLSIYSISTSGGSRDSLVFRGENPRSVVSSPRPEHPRPDLFRPDWLTLNGIWDFAFDFSDSGEEDGRPEGRGFDRKILVPFVPESPLSGIGFTDFLPAVWYKRSFTLPPAWKQKRILLHFEACDYQTTVWVNGEKVGFHEGGYTPFSFDLTEKLRPAENTIVVRVRDDVRSGLQPAGKQSTRLASYSCFYRRTTGIWQSVWLEAVPETYIERLRFYPQRLSGEAALFVSLNRPPEGGNLAVRVSFQGEPVFEALRPAEKVTFIPIKINQPKLWGIREPNLYDLEIVFEKGKEVMDKVTSYFAFRQVETRGDKIFLNGKPIFLRTVLDQGFYPDGIYTAPSDEALRRDIELAMSFGFDGARLHQKVFERRFLFWADRLGYIVWGEFPDWGLDLSRPETFLVFLREWREAIARDFNHPSIIGWCPFNERWGETYPEFIQEIFRFTKEVDPTRLVIDSSGGYHLVSPDVYDAHNYDQNIETFRKAFAELLEFPPRVFVNGDPRRHIPYQGQPYYVSEYGGIWWNPGQTDERGWGYGERPKTAEEFLSRYRQLTEALLNHPRVAGFCYTQLYDIEQEVNGLCTFERKPKFDPEIIRQINQQPAAIERRK